MVKELSVGNFLQLSLQDPPTFESLRFFALGIPQVHDPIRSLYDLKESIGCHVRNIPQFMLLSTIEHKILCFQMVADNGGHHRYHKSMVYRDPITSLSDLKGSIECHVHNIPQFMLLSTVEYVILHFQMVADKGGHHIEHVL